MDAANLQVTGAIKNCDFFEVLVRVRCENYKKNGYAIELKKLGLGLDVDWSYIKAAEWVLSVRYFMRKKRCCPVNQTALISPDELIPTTRAIASEIDENTSAIFVALILQLLGKMLGSDHPMESINLSQRWSTGPGSNAKPMRAWLLS